MEKIICISGPTGSGKTALAVKLSKELDGEVISADSMQIYKYMNIGTAKPTKAETEGIPHHLIDIITPFEEFSVKEFVDLAKEKIKDIANRGKLPIIAGGTGLFINSLIDNVSFSEGGGDEKLREKLQNEAETMGVDYLHDKLREIDPESACRIHKNNIKRVIRAIEIYETTGITMSEQIRNSKKIPPSYEVTYFGLNTDRDVIYDRINRRVDMMIDGGLTKEVINLKNMGLSLKNRSMQAIGYKEILLYLDGCCSLEAAVEKIKKESRNYAKRQLTWFRKDQRIKWIDISKYKNCEEQYEYIKEMGWI